MASSAAAGRSGGPLVLLCVLRQRLAFNQRRDGMKNHTMFLRHRVANVRSPDSAFDFDLCYDYDLGFWILVLRSVCRFVSRDDYPKIKYAIRALE